jgi:hypothetical protein
VIGQVLRLLDHLGQAVERVPVLDVEHDPSDPQAQYGTVQPSSRPNDRTRISCTPASTTWLATWHLLPLRFGIAAPEALPAAVQRVGSPRLG